jgi:hypothetical protein
MDYRQILSDAFELLESHEDMEPKSALKQAAILNGVKTGPEMEKFVSWAMDSSIIGTF